MHRSSKIEQCVYQYESGETTIEMRPTPDKWIDSFISNKTTDMHIITPPNNNSWKPGHRLHRPAKSRRKLPRSKKSMLDALGLPKVQQRTLNNPATILICRPNPTILTQQDLDYDKGDIFEQVLSSLLPSFGRLLLWPTVLEKSITLGVSSERDVATTSCKGPDVHVLDSC